MITSGCICNQVVLLIACFYKQLLRLCRVPAAPLAGLFSFFNLSFVPIRGGMSAVQFSVRLYVRRGGRETLFRIVRCRSVVEQRPTDCFGFWFPPAKETHPAAAQAGSSLEW